MHKLVQNLFKATKILLDITAKTRIVITKYHFLHFSQSVRISRIQPKSSLQRTRTQVTTTKNLDSTRVLKLINFLDLTRDQI